MPRPLITRAQAIALLAEQPKQIARMTAGLNTQQLKQTPEPGEWSCVEMLAHLRTCADMWGQAIDKILAGEDSFTAMNPRTWAKYTNYTELDFAPSFKAFRSQRRKLVKLLEGLRVKDWQRSASVSVAGKRMLRTVHFYADWLAVHERTHMRQFAKTVEAVQVKRT